ncbi:glycosyltransferase [Luedemannella helvata]
MRIGMISEHASPLAALGGIDAGGQNLHVAELAAALVRHGHQVEVYTRRDDPRTPECVRADGYDVVHVPAGPAVALHKDELFGYMRPFGRWVSRRWSGHAGPPDLIHAHFWMSGMAAIEATARHRVPTVLTYHALGVVKRRYQRADDTSPPLRCAVETQLGNAVDRVIAQCRDEVAELAAMGVPLDGVEVVPSGVNTYRFTPDGPAAPRTPGVHRVVTVGRLVPRKGYDDLIRAVHGLGEVELVIVGGPPEGAAADPEGQRLADLARRLGISDRVRLVGPIAPADMPAWYRSADVVACAPWYEPFGLTPLEAMACGVPVVTYAVGGLQDTVLDGVTGRHVPPGDVAGLTQALRDLLTDAPLRRRYGRAALDRARTHYSWPATAAHMATVYAGLLHARNPQEKVAS